MSLSPVNSSTVSQPIRSEREIDRSKVDPAVLEAANGMESMFLEYMMKVMRDTVPENEMDLESPATKVYRGMLDTEYAKKAAASGGLGLGDQVIAYLLERGYTGKR